jgi:hypothetical protein
LFIAWVTIHGLCFACQIAATASGTELLEVADKLASEVQVIQWVMDTFCPASPALALYSLSALPSLMPAGTNRLDLIESGRESSRFD